MQTDYGPTIFFKLTPQLVYAAEAALVAHSPDKVHCYLFAVDIAPEVYDVRLDAERCAVADRGVVAYVDHGDMAVALYGDSRGIDA